MEELRFMYNQKVIVSSDKHFNVTSKNMYLSIYIGLSNNFIKTIAVIILSKK